MLLIYLSTFNNIIIAFRIEQNLNKNEKKKIKNENHYIKYRKRLTTQVVTRSAFI